MSQNSLCTLCSLELPKFPIKEGESFFCCSGCRSVFNILSAKNQLDSFTENPLFHQAVHSGLISNPALLEQLRESQAKVKHEERQKLHLEIANMWCPSCAEVIRLILLREKGVCNCVVDYSTDLASIEFAPKYISKEKICEKISACGYESRSLEESSKKAVSFDLYLRFIIAAFCSVNVMMLAYPLYATYFNYDGSGYGKLFAWLSLAMSLPVLGYSALPIIKRFFASMRVGIFGMETLVMIGITSAFSLSLYDLLTGGTKVYFDSMTVIVVFVLLGKIIESRAKFSAKEALLHLVRASPRRGRKRVDGTCQYVLIKEIQKGDIVVVYAGEKIVLDGIVIEGEGTSDESLMTGESIPVIKRIGSKVLGGAILQNGSIAFQVQSAVEESALHKIIEMIEEDIQHKNHYVRAADAIVRWFVPVILFLTFSTVILCLYLGIADSGKTNYETAILRAVAILLISCPCAIGIAAPLAESHLLNGLASLGAIVRNKGCLPFLGKETTFIFDKTGTLTEGWFTVLSGLANLSDQQKEILRGLASCSTHPVASAVARAIVNPAVSFDRVEEVVGRGLRGEYAGNIFFLGSAKFMKDNAIILNFVEEPEQKMLTTSVYFAQGSQGLTQLLLGDKIKEGAKELITSLKPAKTRLLSGDSRLAVEKVALLCGFDEWQSEFSPLQKREYILELKQKGETVCMLGDGINDSPALTAAHLGISVVSACDMSIQVSDILLTTDRLQAISLIRSLAKKGQKILKQNLFWAFFYNAIGIFLAAFGLLSPIFAAFAMSISSLIVLFNARRL